MKQTILNLLQGNKTLMIINSMIIQNQIMMQKKKKKNPIMQKFSNLNY